jgi:hypothetical protein
MATFVNADIDVECSGVFASTRSPTGRPMRGQYAVNLT